MDEFYELSSVAKRTTEVVKEWNRIAADILEEIRQRGKFDEDGGELSDEDWADSQ